MSENSQLADPIYSSGDAIGALVAAGMISAETAAQLGQLQTGNWNQHVMNVETIIRPLNLSYADVEALLGWSAGVLQASVFVAPQPVEPAPAAPARSFADVMNEAKAAQEAATPRVNPDKVQELSAQIGNLWAQLQHELSKKW